MVSRAVGVIVAMFVVSLAACTSDTSALAIEIRTDVLPGNEFSAIEILVTGGGRDDRVRVPVFAGEDWTVGRRAAEIEPIEDGEYEIRARLLGSAGEVVVEGLSLTSVRGTTVVTIVLTRDCRGVDCTSPDGEARTCLGGRCSDARCAPEMPEACTPECVTDGECAPLSECAVPRCVDGLCLYGVDPSACDADQRCDLELGCLSTAPACIAPMMMCGADCTDPDSDDLHCGGCDQPCAMGSCIGGECVVGCPAPLMTCGAECIDATSDERHCGGCDGACPAPPVGGAAVCADSSCTVTCAPTLSLCSAECVDAASDERHCGGCDRPCGSPPVGGTSTCTGGTCVPGCPAGITLCGTECIDTSADVRHCSGCDRPCPPPPAGGSSTCMGGSCGVSCPAPLVLCDGACMTECRIELGPTTTTYTVPPGCDELRVKAWGAGGGDGQGGIQNTGAGGYAEALVAVTAGEMLEVVVGGAGARGTLAGPGAGGMPGSGGSGGGGGRPGGGGGGFTGIFRGTPSQATALVIAGGGGGGGGDQPAGNPPGAGGGLSGQSGWGTGGTQLAGGMGVAGGGGAASHGGNGIALGGGRGGTRDDGGGGGGSGWFGGGGGAGASTNAGGGGGGSGYTTPAAAMVMNVAGNRGTPGNSADPDRGGRGAPNTAGTMVLRCF